MSTKKNVNEQIEGYAKFVTIAPDNWKNAYTPYHLSKILPIIKNAQLKPKKILEIGFNDARLLRAMQKQFPEASFAGTEVRKDTLDKIKDQNFDIRIADDEKIPGGDKFDLIYGTAVLHHFSEPYAFIRHTYDRLNDGGLVIFSCEPHMSNIPNLVFTTLRRTKKKKKNLLKLSRTRLNQELAKFCKDYKVWFDDGSFFAPFPKLHKIYSIMKVQGFGLLNELHVYARRI